MCGVGGARRMTPMARVVTHGVCAVTLARTPQNRRAVVLSLARHERVKVVVHYLDKIHEATEYALKGECLHHRTNDPPYRPSELELGIHRFRILWDERHAYGDSLAKLWAEGEPFINLEPDVAPWP